MTDLTITLKGAAADKLRKLVAEEHYARPEDAVADALDALDDSRDAELDSWLRDTIAARIDEHNADPSKALTPEEVRRELFGRS
jgi:putative addiction module component (TIGR02574 family)